MSDLTTLARFKTYAGISGVASDVRIGYLITAASKAIEGYLGRSLGRATYTNEEYDGSGSKDLWLNAWPVIQASPFQLQERQTGQNVDSWQTLDAEDYQVYYPEDGQGRVKRVDWGTFENDREDSLLYRVTYTAGYILPSAGATRDLPEDIEFCCWELVNAWLKKSAVGVGGGPVTQENYQGSYSISFGAPLSVLGTQAIFGMPDVQTILDQYRRLDIG